MASVTLTNNYVINWPFEGGTGSTTSGYIITQEQTWTRWVNNTTCATGGNYITMEGAAAVEERLSERSAEVLAQREEERRLVQERRQLRQQEYLDQQQREREDASRRTLERARKLEQAQDRALQVLFTIMTPDQIRQFHLDGQVRVEKPDGDYYVIDMSPGGGVHGNIAKFDEHGCRLGRVCVAPQMYDRTAALPLADGWIGQLLGLTHDTEQFLSHGNWSGRRHCQRLQGEITRVHREPMMVAA